MDRLGKEGHEIETERRGREDRLENERRERKDWCREEIPVKHAHDKQYEMEMNEREESFTGKGGRGVGAVSSQKRSEAGL